MIGHDSVMVAEAVAAMNVKHGGTYVDCTFGFGGHTSEILKAADGNIKLFAIDLDTRGKFAFDNLKEKFNKAEMFFFNKNFCDALVEIGTNGELIDAALFDFGLSRSQIKDSMFSFLCNGPLDMRIGGVGELTAHKIVNTYSAEIIGSILKNNADERLCSQIAREIVLHRENIGEIKDNLELVKICDYVYGKFFKSHSRKNSATKTFQALRIEVNDELAQIRNGVKLASRILKPGGRLCTITFHGGENLILKTTMRAEVSMKKISRLSCKPSRQEQLQNPSSRSAILRVFEKIIER